MSTTTTSVSPADRFAAIAAERRALAMGDQPVASAIEGARYADSFPDSYTPEAVEVSRRLIGAVRAEPTSVPTLATEVLRLQFADAWYA